MKKDTCNRNPVAKHAFKFNKAKVEPDKKKDAKQGKRKHKKDVIDE